MCSPSLKVRAFLSESKRMDLLVVHPDASVFRHCQMVPAHWSGGRRRVSEGDGHLISAAHLLKEMSLLFPVRRCLLHLHGESCQAHLRKRQQLHIIFFCFFYKILCLFLILLYIFPKDIHLCQSCSHKILLILLPLPPLLFYLYEGWKFRPKIYVKQRVAFSCPVC